MNIQFTKNVYLLLEKEAQIIYTKDLTAAVEFINDQYGNQFANLRFSAPVNIQAFHAEDAQRVRVKHQQFSLPAHFIDETYQTLN
jgi:hypothetical protein